MLRQVAHGLDGGGGGAPPPPLRLDDHFNGLESLVGKSTIKYDLLRNESFLKGATGLWEKSRLLRGIVP